MSQFEHLQKMEVTTAKTVEYPVYALGEKAVLHVLPATEANKKYFGKLLKTTRRNAQMARAKGGMDAAMMKQSRKEDRALYPEYIIAGWDDIPDKDGKPVKFDKDSAKNLVDAMPDWMFDDLRNFCSTPQNFIEHDLDVEETGKN